MIAYEHKWDSAQPWGYSAAGMAAHLQAVAAAKCTLPASLEINVHRRVKELFVKALAAEDALDFERMGLRALLTRARNHADIRTMSTDQEIETFIHVSDTLLFRLSENRSLTDEEVIVARQTAELLAAIAQLSEEERYAEMCAGSFTGADD